MTEEDDIDALAAEYVLGSLSPAERAEVDARRRHDASLAAAIEAWQHRLGPLSEEAPDLEPPAHLFSRILARIPAESTPADRLANVVPLRASGRRFRLGAVVSALAACVALAVVWFEHTQPGPPGTQPTWVSCGTRYKVFWEQFDRQKYARISAEQLAGLSRMALRAYDACEAGDEQDARALFDRLARMQF
jgi:anti-sigma-K factor RskA